AEPGRDTLFGVCGDGVECHWFARRARYPATLRRRDDTLFDERVPRVARGAATDPFRKLVAAVLADEGGRGLGGHQQGVSACASLAYQSSSATRMAHGAPPKPLVVPAYYSYSPAATISWSPERRGAAKVGTARLR